MDKKVDNCELESVNILIFGSYHNIVIQPKDNTSIEQTLGCYSKNSKLEDNNLISKIETLARELDFLKKIVHQILIEK